MPLNEHSLLAPKQPHLLDRAEQGIDQRMIKVDSVRHARSTPRHHGLGNVTPCRTVPPFLRSLGEIGDSDASVFRPEITSGDANSNHRTGRNEVHVITILIASMALNGSRGRPQESTLWGQNLVPEADNAWSNKQSSTMDDTRVNSTFLTLPYPLPTCIQLPTRGRARGTLYYIATVHSVRVELKCISMSCLTEGLFQELHARSKNIAA
jgi:hypothetical protein